MSVPKKRPQPEPGAPLTAEREQYRRLMAQGLNTSIRQTSRRGIRRPCEPRRGGSRLQPHQQVVVVAVAVE